MTSGTRSTLKIISILFSLGSLIVLLNDDCRQSKRDAADARRQQARIAEVKALFIGTWLDTTDTNGFTCREVLTFNDADTGTRNLIFAPACTLSHVFHYQLNNQKEDDLRFPLRLTLNMQEEVADQGCSPAQKQQWLTNMAAFQRVEKRTAHLVGQSVELAGFTRVSEPPDQRTVRSTSYRESSVLAQMYEDASQIDLNTMLSKHLDILAEEFGRPKLHLLQDSVHYDLSWYQWGSQDYLGRIYLREGQPYFATDYWIPAVGGVIVGAWRNLRYLDSNGQPQRGDIYICYRSRQEQKYWFVRKR